MEIHFILPTADLLFFKGIRLNGPMFEQAPGVGD